MDDEFKFFVLPSNESPRLPTPSPEIIIGFHADITLLNYLDVSDEDEIDDVRDIDRTTQERFVYSKDLKVIREDLQNGNVSRTELVNALTEIEVPESYHTEIVDKVLSFTKDEQFSHCAAVCVDIELVKYADDEEEEEGGDEEEEEGDDIIEPSFRMVLVDEKMSKTENCVICMGRFEMGVDVSKLKCSHVFHRRCLLEWLDESVTCPLCRMEPPNFCSA